MKRGSSSGAYERLKKHRLLSKEVQDEGSSSDDENSRSSSSSNVSNKQDYQDPVVQQPEIGDPSEISNLESHTQSASISDTESNLSMSDSESDYYSNDSCSFSSSFSDSDPSDNEDFGDFNRLHNPIDDLKQGLRAWSLRNFITLKALSQLLLLLHAWLIIHCSFLQRWLSGLPKDARTLLGTSKATGTTRRPMESQAPGKFGEFAYFGLRRTLQKMVSERFFPDHLITLCFNVDGLPLYKSSSTSFWPILCKIFHPLYRWKPFPVAIYSGPGKPKELQDYLQEFVEEVKSLVNDGIVVKGVHYVVQVMCYICDTPARAFLKCTVGQGGFFSCERCVVKGATVNRKRVYPDTGCDRRTEESFLNQEQEEHHTGISPLTGIPYFKPVKSFVLDSMHLLSLGVMKRLLSFYWIGLSGKKSSVKIRAGEALRLSKRLEDLRWYVTKEFPRKIRGLSELARFKATEFRFFLLYCGPVVLKDILPVQYYKHFILLHAASRILCSAELSRTLLQYAKDLLKHFFDFLPELYGADAQITNMHNLLHAADDVENHACTLDEISAFDFENELGKMKRILRTANKPLGQYCRRLNELGPPPPPKRKMAVKPVIHRSARGNMVSVVYLDITLTSEQPDNFALLHNDAIVEITSIEVSANKDVVLHGREWQEKLDIFQYPCPSSTLLEWEIRSPSNSSSFWKLEDVKCKLIHICPLPGGEKKHFAIAILHSAQ